MTRPAKSRDPRKRAAEVLREANVTTIPIPVDTIAQQAGITLRYMALDDSLSGMIFMQEGVPTVVVNSLHHANRRRFTIAHELGHFELHMSTIGADVHVDKRFLARDENSSTGFDKKEIEANLFAAELLVPRQLLLDELRGRTVDVEMDDELLGELADKFGVSKQMMAIRVGKLF